MNLKLFSSLFCILLISHYSQAETLSDYQTQIQGKKFFSPNEIIALKEKNLLEKYKERQTSNPYNGPIIDVHDHPNYKGRDKKRVKPNGPNGPDIIKIKNNLNVIHTIVMNTPGDYRSKKKRYNSTKFAKRYDNVSALCRADLIGFRYKFLKNNLDSDSDKVEKEVKRIEENLKKNNCIGIGEVGPVHYNKHAKTILPGGKKKASQGALILDLNDQIISKILELANFYKVPIVFHIEPFYVLEKINREKEVLSFYKKNCRKYPNAKIILAHLGHFSPATLGHIFDICPNTFADFKFTHSWGLYWGGHDLNHPSDLDFRIHERWAKFFEKYPDRVMYGSDWKLGRKYSFDDFPYHLKKVRLMIGSLKESVQKQIMYSNAKKIFNINN